MLHEVPFRIIPICVPVVISIGANKWANCLHLEIAFGTTWAATLIIVRVGLFGVAGRRLGQCELFEILNADITRTGWLYQ
jgi:hypothetical protein